jgi:hypothetical protein
MKTPTVYCVLTTSDGTPALIEFDSARQRLEWLAGRSDAHDDFYSFEVVGKIDGLTIPNVGRYALEELQDLDADGA